MLDTGLLVAEQVTFNLFGNIYIYIYIYIPTIIERLTFFGARILSPQAQRGQASGVSSGAQISFGNLRTPTRSSPADLRLKETTGGEFWVYRASIRLL